MNIKEAKYELELAAKLNPGDWVTHSYNVAKAAKIISKATKHFDPNLGYIYGLLHDIGRRNGFSHLKHMIDGYIYLQDKDAKAAMICLSHAFPNKNLNEYQGKIDIPTSKQKWLTDTLKKYKYDYYDELIQLADALADSKGFVKMEVRWIDVSIRNGIRKGVVEKWKKILEFKSNLEEKYKINIDDILGL